jgi:hypothetical protein
MGAWHSTRSHDQSKIEAARCDQTQDDFDGLRAEPRQDRHPKAAVGEKQLQLIHTVPHKDVGLSL